MDEVLDILETLVAFDTTSRNSNLELIDWVQQRLEAAGAVCSRDPDESGQKTNLLARLGPDVAGGVVLSAHTDCVPVDDQPWSTDPFVLTPGTDGDGDKVYGRGTCDMKGFLAVALDVAAGIDVASLTRPLLFALSYDEEIGIIGASTLAGYLVEHQARPSAVIVGEPTSMKIVNAHKGMRSFTTTVTGVDAHSSQPQNAANAIAGAARIATFIDDLAAQKREEAVDPSFVPPYTTFNLATIAGGSAINIIPREAVLTWEYRPVPADDSFALREQVDAFVTDQVLPHLRRDVQGADVVTESVATAPGLAPEDGGEAEQLVRRLLGGTQEPPETVAYGTDGGYFQLEELSTIVCGPGSIDQAHKADEFVAVDQLARCRDFLTRLVAELSA